MPKLIFYTPFPYFDNKQSYNLFLDALQRDTSNVGLPLKYDSTAQNASWQGFSKHARELNSFKGIHITKFSTMLKNKGNNSEVVGWDYPTKLGQKLFQQCSQEDILFIHSHGNQDVIGTGGFILTPKLLAENLEILGLSKQTPPVIVVWACKSGVASSSIDEIASDSYAASLRTELKNLSYNNICVAGISATIMIHPQNSDDPVTYVRKEMKLRNAPEREVEEKKALEINLSPPQKNDFKHSINKNANPAAESW